MNADERSWPGGCPVARAAARFQRHGGLVTGDACAEMLLRAGGCPQPMSQLARWIVDREVLCLEWHGVHMLPLAQFESPRPCVKPAVRRALAELRGVFDDRELALWFVEPNDWLDGAMPIDCVEGNGDALHHAARADRYVAAGC
jgi:hypothetical protein